VLLGRGELLAAPHRGAARPAETVPRRVLLVASRAWNLSLGHGLLVLLPRPNNLLTLHQLLTLSERTNLLMRQVILSALCGRCGRYLP
jgi:hypothetical protein